MEKNKSIEKLNEALPEFFVSDLEERLETDPMKVGALVTLQSTGHYGNCGVHTGFCLFNFCPERSGK